MGIRSRFVRDCEGKQMLIDKIFYYKRWGGGAGGCNFGISSNFHIYLDEGDG